MALFIPTDRPIVNPLTGAIDFGWLNLFNQIANGTGNIPWGNIDFTGSTLADIVTRSAAALNSGTLSLARLSGITTTQLSATAGILGTQLSASAAIALTQLNVTGTLNSTTFLRGDGAFSTITKAAFVTHSSGTVAAGATVYFSAYGNSATETQVSFVCPVAGTIRNLYASADAAPGAAQTFTYTVRKGAADTAVTCQTSGGAATASNDTTHSATVAAGDLLTVKLVTSAGAAVQRHTAAFEVATA